MQKVQIKRHSNANSLGRGVETRHPYIWRKKGVCGGVPVIKHTRIPVSLIAELERHGMSVDEIIADYPHLNHAQVFGALSYYYAHKKEIDREIHMQEQVLKGLIG